MLSTSELIITMIVIFIFGVFFAYVCFILDEEEKKKKRQEEQREKEQMEKKQTEKDERIRKALAVPIRQLTQEEIDEIHSRGKLTPDEKVKEWESYGLCAPGDAIGSAGWRCEIFKNCHACLIHYANENLQRSAMEDELKIVNSTIKK